jgi:predicted nucleic acid-binding protein
LILLDTNVLSALMRATPDRVVALWLDTQPRQSVWTTSITVFEIEFGLALLPAGRRRSLMQSTFARLIDDQIDRRVAIFDASAATYAAQLSAERQRNGRSGELRDTMIAGIAIAQRATLATRNIRHFDDLATPVVNPWAPA